MWIRRQVRTPIAWRDEDTYKRHNNGSSHLSLDPHGGQILERACEACQRAAGRLDLELQLLTRIILDTHMSVSLKDSYNRAIRDLRVSLTDRCNCRCFYCLPHGEPPIAPKEQMLSYEEIEYVCDIFVELGIEKIRLTGGEPMMRRDIETIIGKLARLTSKGLLELALTTNGYYRPVSS